MDNIDWKSMPEWAEAWLEDVSGIAPDCSGWVVCGSGFWFDADGLMVASVGSDAVIAHYPTDVTDPRNTQQGIALDLIARSIEVWPDDNLFAYWEGCVKFTLPPSDKTLFSRREVENRRHELTKEPEDKHTPDWAKWKAQDADGLWWLYESMPVYVRSTGSWDPMGGEFIREQVGEVIGDWKNTLKPVSREVEFVWGKKYRHKSNQTVHEFIGLYPNNEEYGVFSDPDVGTVVECLHDFLPAQVSCEEWCSIAEKVINESNTACELSTIFHAIAEKRLPVPEITPD